MKFSKRQGLVPVRTTLQTNSMSPELRASLWNVLHVLIWNRDGFQWAAYAALEGEWVQFAQKLWLHYFKRPLSEIPRDPEDLVSELQDYFFSQPWHAAYDFIEAVLEIEGDSSALNKAFNFILERELAGYRLVERKFVPVIRCRWWRVFR